MGEEEFLQLSQDVLGLSNERIDPPELKGLVDTIPDLVNTAIDNAKTEMQGAASGVTWRIVDGGVDTVSLSNITLSGLQDINGVPKSVDLKVLVAGQTNKAQNGLYLMKSTSWVRIPGYDTASSLSSVFVSVNSGDYAASVYFQPATLANVNDVKDFKELVNFNFSLQALAASLREDFKDFTVTVATTGQVAYSIPETLPANAIVKKVIYQQPDFDRTLTRDQDWTFDKTNNRIVLTTTAASRVYNGHRLRIETSSYGSLGAFSGIVFKSSGSNLYYRLGYETDADLKLTGEVPSGGGGTLPKIEMRYAATGQAARDMATGTTPFLVLIADDGSRPTPRSTVGLFDPSQQGKISLMMIYGNA